jgi:hypothetical protein
MSLELEEPLQVTIVPEVSSRELEAKAEACAEPPLVLIVAGKMGNGKSSTANTLIGRKCFASRHGMSAVTLQSQREECERDDVLGRVVVVDVPGVGDPNSTPEKLHTLIKESIAALPYGPDTRYAIVLVMGLHQRASDTDLIALWNLRLAFGRTWLAQTVVVWTHGALLGEEGELSSFLGETTPHLTEILEAVKGGQVVLENNPELLIKRASTEEKEDKKVRVA